ncbi:MAG: DUF4965 domain-containing protein [Planctomycetes bacterium]|nr:DUF4965 domain-containing protein [Planctomycetota bacterium]
MLAVLLAVLLQVPPAAPASEQARGVRLGRSVPITAPVPPKMRWETPQVASARQGRMFGYRLALPQGAYRVELGFGEIVYWKKGDRLFSVKLNGATVAQDMDLVERAGPAPSRLIETFDAQAGEHGLEVRLQAQKGEALLSWLRVRGEGVDWLIDCGGEADLPAPQESAQLGEALIARFGARAFFNPKPQFLECEHSPLGKFAERPAPVLLGLMFGREKRCLPLCGKKPDFSLFDSVAERHTITTLCYDFSAPGFRGTISLVAPFHPGDLELSSVPAFDIHYEVEGLEENAPLPLAALVHMPFEGATAQMIRSAADGLTGVVLTKEVAGRRTERGLFAALGTGEAGARPGAPSASIAEDGVWLTVPLRLEQGKAEADLVYAAFTGDPVLTVDGVPHRLSYAARFSSAVAVARFALAHRAAGRRAAEVVDALASEAVLDGALKKLMVSAIPSFLLNTFLTEGEDGSSWYSCVEGYCGYHSTLDVEYSAAPFYLWFAPDLLRRQLLVWPRYERERVMPHDVGRGDTVAGQAYPYDMPVEENANYVLLLFQYWTVTGADAFVLERFPLVERLLGYLADADPDGDGFPERGTANTVDDASAAVHFSREQVYLAVKCAAAFLAGAEMADAAGEEAAAVRFRGHSEKIRATLDAEAWLGDHYAVCLDRTLGELEEPFRGRARREMGADDPLPGWDSAHPYTSLGLLYLLRSGVDLPFDLERLALDSRTAAAATERAYVWAHAEHELNGWVSLDLFRDAVQCYLGEDVLGRSSRYAALQSLRARSTDLEDWAGFCDSPYNRHLCYYPRGAAVLALVDAAAGLALDRRKGTLRLRPVRVPLRVPLAVLADWKELRVPWLDVRRGGEGGKVEVEITDRGLLEGLEVTVDLSLVEGRR